MILLADENIESAMIHWLRSKGHDVLWAAESLISQSDNELCEIANQQKRILLTRDLDFGELIYREKLCSHGIVLLRIKAINQHDRLRILQKNWNQIENNTNENFVVVTEKRIRIRPLEIK